jgi:hypothetical protein
MYRFFVERPFLRRDFVVNVHPIHVWGDLVEVARGKGDGVILEFGLEVAKASLQASL